MPYPTYVSSATSTDGTKVILTYDQPLSPDTASIGDFTVRVDGSQRTVTDAATSAADNTKVELTLSTSIQSGEIVTVSYTDPSSNDDVYAVQSLSSGEDADPFSDQPVTNNSTVYASSTSEYSPSDTFSASIISIDENSGPGQVVYIPTSTSENGATYRLLTGNNDDADDFSINQSTGEVTLIGDPDYEAKSSYSFTLIVDNPDGTTSQEVISLAINNVAEINQLGIDLVGEVSGDEFGLNTALSADGSILAVGGRKHDGNTGHVRVYRWDGSTNSWSQIGNDIDGEAAGDYSGSDLALSSDGLTVAIGAGGNGGNGANSGHVRIYTWNSNNND